MDAFEIFGYSLEEWSTVPWVVTSGKIIVVLLIGLPIIKLLRKGLQKWVSNHYSTHYAMLASKGVSYTGFAIIGIYIMQILGFSLAPLLGAAGIVGIALGFASQTSVSNIISGLFLIVEQPFKVDDIVTIDNTTGVVLSIDVLSVKLRTFDNKFVRVPNESIIKTQITNNTRFPIRRFNGMISVAYGENIERVKEILLDIADKNEYALSEPEPRVIFDNFGQSSIDLLFLVWAERDHWLMLKDSINEQVKKRFDEEGIEIPFPHVSIYAGKHSDPIPYISQSQSNSDQKT
jgi:small-conductance mechanosensitive channel